jgi:hypothetical protein
MSLSIRPFARKIRATDNEPLDGMTRAEVPALPMQRGPNRVRLGGGR